ncbi:MAG: ferritin family protein [Thermoplasmata archaeon]
MADTSKEHIEILQNAIVMEVEGAKFFSNAALRMKHPQAKDMFVSLATQERRHVKVLEEELQRLERGDGWVSPSSVKGSAASDDSVFKEAEGAKGPLDPKAGELAVLKYGMEVERKSIEYYKRAGADIEDSRAREVFNWLVGEEAGHLTILNAEYDLRSRSGFYFDVPEFSLEVM